MSGIGLATGPVRLCSSPGADQPGRGWWGM